MTSDLLSRLAKAVAKAEPEDANERLALAYYHTPPVRLQRMGFQKELLELHWTLVEVRESRGTGGTITVLTDANGVLAILSHLPGGHEEINDLVPLPPEAGA